MCSNPSDSLPQMGCMHPGPYLRGHDWHIQARSVTKGRLVTQGQYDLCFSPNVSAEEKVVPCRIFSHFLPLLYSPFLPNLTYCHDRSVASLCSEGNSSMRLLPAGLTARPTSSLPSAPPMEAQKEPRPLPGVPGADAQVF